MMHPDKDKILSHSLNILEGNEAHEVEDHLSKCDECRTSYNTMINENKIIAGIEPDVDYPAISFPRKQSKFADVFFKVAALLMIGFLLGYSTSRLSLQPCVNIIPHQEKSRIPQLSDSDYLHCEALDTYVSR